MCNLSLMAGTTDILDWCYVEAYGNNGKNVYTEAPSIEDTVLDCILPCVDVEIAEQFLNQSKTVTNKVVTVVKKVLGTIANSNFPPDAGPLYYNQSGPLVPTLCNPYTGRLDDQQSNTVEVNLTNAP